GSAAPSSRAEWPDRLPIAGTYAGRRKVQAACDPFEVDERVQSDPIDRCHQFDRRGRQELHFSEPRFYVGPRDREEGVAGRRRSAASGAEQQSGAPAKVRFDRVLAIEGKGIRIYLQDR